MNFSRFKAATRTRGNVKYDYGEIHRELNIFPRISRPVSIALNKYRDIIDALIRDPDN